MPTLVQPSTEETIRLDALSPELTGFGVVSDEIETSVPDVAESPRQRPPEYAALKLDGLYGTSNQLFLPQEDPARPDTGIACRAVEAMDRHFASESIDRPGTRPAGYITVSVRSGWVTLRGSLLWRHQRSAMEQIVRDVPGVRGVTNQISTEQSQRTTSYPRDRWHPSVIGPNSSTGGAAAVNARTSSHQTACLCVRSSFLVSPHHAESWIQACNYLAALADSSSGCRHFRLGQDQKDALYFEVDSEWEDAAAYVSFEQTEGVTRIEQELASRSFLKEMHVCNVISPVLAP